MPAPWDRPSRLLQPRQLEDAQGTPTRPTSGLRPGERQRRRRPGTVGRLELAVVDHGPPAAECGHLPPTHLDPLGTSKSPNTLKHIATEKAASIAKKYQGVSSLFMLERGWIARACGLLATDVVGVVNAGFDVAAGEAAIAVGTTAPLVRGGPGVVGEPQWDAAGRTVRLSEL